MFVYDKISSPPQAVGTRPAVGNIGKEKTSTECELSWLVALPVVKVVSFINEERVVQAVWKRSCSQ